MKIKKCKNILFFLLAAVMFAAGAANAAEIAATYTNNTQSLKNKLSKVETEDDEKMMEACKEFETYMLEQVYKQMEKTIMRSDDSQGDYEKMFSDMRIQQYAERATEQGGIGLAQQLYESMKLQASAIPPAEVRNNLQIVIDRIAEKSKRTWTFRGKKEVSDTVEHVWTRFKQSGGGVTYEINRDHPLVDQIVAQCPEIKSKLETLLKSVERGLPLNQLYVDLNNDEKIDNDVQAEESEIRSMLGQMLSAMSSSIVRKEFLSKIEHTEPFCNYPEIVKEFADKET